MAEVAQDYTGLQFMLNSQAVKKTLKLKKNTFEIKFYSK